MANVNETPKEKSAQCNWSIDSFPRALKDAFIGYAKTRQLTTPALLEEVVTAYLDESAPGIMAQLREREQK